MRALRVHEFGPPESLRLDNVPTPEPGPGEVRVDVRACGVNFPDVMVIAGTYQLLPDRPFVPGKEIAGTVSAIGPGVSGIQVGQRVRAPIEWGAFQEQVCVPAALCHSVPNAMSFREAAAFNLTYLTAYYALTRRAAIQPGETVLITAAAGGVGTAAIQIARALGATVIAHVGSSAKRTVAEAAGADHVINSSQGDLRDLVRELTNGRGANVVLEMVGGDVFDSCLRATAWEGRVVSIGFASGSIPAARAGYLLVKNIAVLGLQVTDYRDREPEGWLAAMDRLDEMYLRGHVRPVISATYPLERAAEALAVVQRGESTGKIILTILSVTHGKLSAD
jgi:NADPH:quinone reductase